MRWKSGFLGGMAMMAAMACTQPAKAPAGEGENPVVDFTGVGVPAPLRDSLRAVVDGYKVLSGALSAGDTLLADAAAQIMRRGLDSLPLYTAGLDSAHAGALELNTGSISAELAAMALEQGGLEGRRRAFEMASEMLFDLLRQTGGVTGGAMYRYHCAEAFGGKGAYWLGDSSFKGNPYGAGTACREVRDTIR